MSQHGAAPFVVKGHMNDPLVVFLFRGQNCRPGAGVFSPHVPPPLRVHRVFEGISLNRCGVFLLSAAVLFFYLCFFREILDLRLIKPPAA